MYIKVVWHVSIFFLRQAEKDEDSNVLLYIMLKAKESPTMHAKSLILFLQCI